MACVAGVAGVAERVHCGRRQWQLGQHAYLSARGVACVGVRTTLTHQMLLRDDACTTLKTRYYAPAGFIWVHVYGYW